MIVLLLLLVGCAPVQETTELLARAQLVRASLDLRGVPPRDVDLDAIEDKPELYADFVERWLHDPRFGERVRVIFDMRYRMRTGRTELDAEEFGLEQGELAASLADMPLRLLSHVAEADLPFTDILTADYALADAGVAAVLGLGQSRPGWHPARWLDERPAAGVLASSSLWMRYPSTGGNANRARANALARILLCDDYLQRPLSFRPNALEDNADPEVAIAEQPGCRLCHASLDPLAAHLFGFWSESDDDPIPLYRPEREERWRDYADLPPSWFDQHTTGLTELGDRIADDPRFARCTVRAVAEGLLQREIPDPVELEEHEEAFVASGLRLRSVFRSILLSPEYGELGAEDPEDDARRGYKLVDPAQLGARIEALTGYRWTRDEVDLLTAHGSRLASLAGGTDALTGSNPNWTPSVARVLVQERLAWLAAWHAVGADLEGEDPGLLDRVETGQRPEDEPALFELQCRRILERVRGEPLAGDSDEAEALVQLWKQAWSLTGSERSAWSAVVAAALRDPRLLLY